MAPKRSSLFGNMAPKTAAETDPVAEEKVAPAPVPEAAPAQAAASAAPAETPPSGRYPKAKTREGKRVATVYLEREAHRQLQKLVFEEETTIQDLLLEGVNAVFERRGLSRIA